MKSEDKEIIEKALEEVLTPHMFDMISYRLVYEIKDKFEHVLKEKLYYNEMCSRIRFHSKLDNNMDEDGTYKIVVSFSYMFESPVNFSDLNICFNTTYGEVCAYWTNCEKR